MGNFTLRLGEVVRVDRKFDIGSALTESSQQPSDGSGYRCWALLACSSLQSGGQPLDFMGPLCKLTH